MKTVFCNEKDCRYNSDLECSKDIILLDPVNDEVMICLNKKLEG